MGPETIQKSDERIQRVSQAKTRGTGKAYKTNIPSQEMPPVQESTSKQVYQSQEVPTHRMIICLLNLPKNTNTGPRASSLRSSATIA